MTIKIFKYISCSCISVGYVFFECRYDGKIWMKNTQQIEERDRMSDMWLFKIQNCIVVIEAFLIKTERETVLMVR